MDSIVEGRGIRATLAGLVLVGMLIGLAPIVLAESDPDVGRINREVGRLIAKGWFDDAVGLAQKAAELAGSTLDASDPANVEALRNLAIVRKQTGDSDGAQALFEKVLTIQEQSLGVEHPDLVPILDALADLHRQARSFDEAEPLYERSLQIQEKHLGPENLKIADALSNLAGLHQMRGDFSQAGSLLERAIGIQEKNLGPNHPDLVTSLKFLATIRQVEDDRVRAKALLDRAVEIEMTSAARLPSADPGRGAIGLTVMVDPSASKAASGQRRMDAVRVYFVRMDDGSEPYNVAGRVWPAYSWGEQESFARRTTDVLESTYSKDGDVYLVNVEPGRYLAVGAVLIDSGSGQTVAYHAYFSTEIVSRTEVTVRPGELTFMGEVRGTARGTADPTQRFFYDAIPRPSGPAISVYGLGSIYYRRDAQWTQFDTVERGGKSETAFWGRTRKTFKNETTWLAMVPDPKSAGQPTSPEETKLGQRNQRALDQMLDGDYKEAVASAQRALKICESYEGAEDGCLAPTLGNLADILTAKNEASQARSLYERALELRERKLGTEHPAVACTLLSLARLSLSEGDPEMAESLGERALGLFEKTLGSDHPAVSDALELLASVYEAKGDHEQTTAALKRALRVREDALGWTHLTVAPLLERLARQALAGNEFDLGAELMERSLAIHERKLGNEHWSVGDSLYTLAQAYLGQGDHDQAAASLERALAIQEDTYGNKDQRVIDTMVSLAACREQQGEAETAQRLRVQADELRQQKALADLSAIGKAMVRFATEEAKYPTTSDIEALRQLLEPTYLRTMPVEDGWGHPYVVESSATSYTLRSLGKDGLADSGNGGATSSFTADIVFADGALRQWPEGPQQ